jgi:hypothetical protein
VGRWGHDKQKQISVGNSGGISTRDLLYFMVTTVNKNVFLKLRRQYYILSVFNTKIYAD